MFCGAEVNKEKRKEAIYFFENNWKLFRDEAMRQGVIKSYNALEITKDNGEIEILLMTEFTDSLQYQMAEERFHPILEKLRPNGPVLLNNTKQPEFRETITSGPARVLFKP